MLLSAILISISSFPAVARKVALNNSKRDTKYVRSLSRETSETASVLTTDEIVTLGRIFTTNPHLNIAGLSSSRIVLEDGTHGTLVAVTNKQIVQDLLRRIPDDASLEEIAQELKFMLRSDKACLSLITATAFLLKKFRMNFPHGLSGNTLTFGSFDMLRSR